MGWTAPSTYSVAQVVTAAILNTDVRDNLNYLKGNAGVVVISDEIQSVIAAGATLTAQGTNNSSFGRLKLIGKTSGGTAIDWRIMANANVASELVIYDAGTPNAERLRIDSSGNVGIGTITPQGKIHTYNTISGVLHWEWDGVNNTARVAIPNGAGDVLYRAMGMFVSRASDGSTAVGNIVGATMIPGGGDQVIHTAGGTDSLAIRVNADGSVDVRRSAGSTYTFKVTLWLLWL